MQFRLRTLLIVLALGPMVLAGFVVLVASFLRGPDISMFDIKTGPWPETALHLHSYQNDIAGMRKELGNAAKINEPDSRGRTAIHWAVVGDSRQAVQFLLENGSSASIRDCFGYLPVDYARDQTVREMLETAADKHGITAVRME